MPSSAGHAGVLAALAYQMPATIVHVSIKDSRRGGSESFTRLVDNSRIGRKRDELRQMWRTVRAAETNGISPLRWGSNRAGVALQWRACGAVLARDRTICSPV